MGKNPLPAVVAFAVAVLAALGLGYLAHDILGFPSLAIGVDALAGAGLVAVTWAGMTA